MITAAILVIGDEILSGDVQDLHVAYMAPRFMERGIELKEVRIVPDSFDRIVKAIKELSASNTFLFTTGGIGPTHDDITKSCVASAFQCNLTPHAEAIEIIKTYWNIEENVLIPETAQLIVDPKTHIFSFYIQNVYVLPGVPFFMKTLFDLMISTLPFDKPIHKVSKQFLVTEDKIATLLKDIQEENPNVSIGSYPFYHPLKGVNIVIKGKEKDVLKNLMNHIGNQIKELIKIM